MGSAWLISPLASTVKSIFNLFSGSSANSQTTRYRASTRAPFNITEGISPETGSGLITLNESAAGLTGAAGFSATIPTSASGALSGSALTMTSSNSRLSVNDRQALVSALRRSLSESRGISDVLTEFEDGL